MDARAQLLQVIAELHMMSHVSAVNLNPSAPSSDDEIGGRCPPGGINRKDDRSTEGFRQKSAEHFAARARKCRTARDYEAVLKDATDALDAWKRTPAPTGIDPPFGTVQWKRWIAASEETNAELARRFNVSAQYIGQVRRQYGTGSAAA